MPTSAEYGIFSANKYENAANKYENANNSWHFILVSREISMLNYV